LIGHLLLIQLARLAFTYTARNIIVLVGGFGTDNKTAHVKGRRLEELERNCDIKSAHRIEVIDLRYVPVWRFSCTTLL
jgi:hypothetical protein